MNWMEYEKLSPEARDRHDKEQKRLTHVCMITAGIVSLFGVLGWTGWCFLIFWGVGFCYIAHAFEWVKNEILRFFLYAIAQIAFILLLMWWHIKSQ